MDETTETPDVVTIKKSLIRKVLIVAAAATGLIITGALLSRNEEDLKDEDNSIDNVVVLDPAA